MKIYFKNDFLLGLYALLRQSELSIHRGMNEWAALQDYVHSHGIIDIINYLVNSHTGKLQQPITNPILKTIFYILKKGYISDVELNEIINILVSTSVVLNNKTPDSDDVIKLRINMRNFSDMVRCRIHNDKTRLQLADKIEHFNQSDYGVFYKIEDIVPAEWYKYCQ